jgi:hypothetical protein
MGLTGSEHRRDDEGAGSNARLRSMVDKKSRRQQARLDDNQTWWRRSSGWRSRFGLGELSSTTRTAGLLRPVGKGGVSGGSRANAMAKLQR